MKRLIVTSLLVAGFAGNALAAEFFVVQGPDKKCTIVETRPTDSTMTIVSGKSFATREEATRQLQTCPK